MNPIQKITRFVPAKHAVSLMDEFKAFAFKGNVIDMAVGDLRLYFPRVREARLLKAHVVKEQRATFSAAPETESLRPGSASRFPNLFMAGDWTRTGWPATMEGAVRSGYLAAEAVAAAAGSPARFLLPD